MLTTVLTGETVQHLVPVIALLGFMEVTVAEVYSENTELSITFKLYISHPPLHTACVPAGEYCGWHRYV